MKTALKLTGILWLMLSLAACTPETGSEAWCAQMKDTPKGDWSTNEASDYARHCLFSFSHEVGSEAWCADLREKPKGEWSANEATSYAKHCIF